MYPGGIDDRLKTTPLCGISSFASSPLPRGPTIVTNLDWTLHHASIVEQGLGVCCLISKLSRPSPRCSSLSDVDLREHVDRISLRGFYRTGGRRSGAIGLVSCEFCVCSSCSSRGVCSLPLPSPFPLASPLI